MPRLLFFLLFVFPLSCYAQKVMIQNGRIWVDDSLLFYYYEHGEKIETFPFAGGGFSQMLTPEETDAPFKDIIIKSTEGEPLIYITAKVLSSPANTYLLYLYKIEFQGLDTGLYVPFHPYFFEEFVKSLVRSHSAGNNAFREKFVNTLIRFWRNKPNAIDDNVFQLASICNYNRSPYTVEPQKNNGNHINIKDNNIYVSDTLLATYRLSKGILAHALPGNSKNSFYYYIESPSGSTLCEFQVIKRYADVLFWPNGYKKPISLYTAVRDEKRLVWEVVNTLLNEKQYLSAIQYNK